MDHSAGAPFSEFGREGISMHILCVGNRIGPHLILKAFSTVMWPRELGHTQWYTWSLAKVHRNSGALL